MEMEISRDECFRKNMNNFHLCQAFSLSFGYVQKHTDGRRHTFLVYAASVHTVARGKQTLRVLSFAVFSGRILYGDSGSAML